jgi:hypothetical protein
MEEKWMKIRSYKPADYNEVQNLYKNSGWFDESIDSKEMLSKQIRKSPGSILVALAENEIVGTVSMLATGRLALIFRLIANDENVRGQLLIQAELFLVKKGYERIDVVAPEEDHVRHEEYLRNGFTKGNPYRWFWKRPAKKK